MGDILLIQVAYKTGLAVFLLSHTHTQKHTHTLNTGLLSKSYRSLLFHNVLSSECNLHDLSNV